MIPTDFPQANRQYTAPPDFTEQQVMTIPAYGGEAIGGSCDGQEITVVAWTPSEAEMRELCAGKPVFITMFGGLAPHFLSTSFQNATHPA